MTRVAVIDPKTATGEARQLLDAVQSGLGMVPNFIRVLANSPAALSAFLGLHGIASAGSLEPKTRERIALAVAEQNACQYCVSAHTAIGRKAEFEAVRAAGHTDAEIIEIITHVAMNVFTNLLGKATQIDIDFPRIDLKKVA